MREGQEGDVDIQDVRKPVFQALLYFTYTDQLPEVRTHSPRWCHTPYPVCCPLLIFDNDAQSSETGFLGLLCCLSSHSYICWFSAGIDLPACHIKAFVAQAVITR